MEKNDSSSNAPKNDQRPEFDLSITDVVTPPVSQSDAGSTAGTDARGTNDSLNDINDLDGSTTNLFDDFAKTLEGSQFRSAKSNREPDIIDFDSFSNPFGSSETGDGVRLRTALPGPIPDKPDNGDVKDKEDKKDGPRIVTALMVVSEPAVKDVSPVEENGFKRPESLELSPKAERRMKNVQEVADFANKNFDQLDHDKDGKISVKDLEQKVMDQNFANGDNAAKLVALFSVTDGLTEALGGSESKGLSKDDFKKLAELAKDKDFFRKSDRAVAIKDLTTVFSKLNTDGSSYDLTPKEVDETLKRKDLSDEQRQALSDVRKYQEHMLTKEYPNSRKDSDGTVWIQNSSGGPFITSTKLENMGNLKSYELNNNFLSHKEYMVNSISDGLDRAKERVANAKATENGISQGADGSCFFIAPLSALQGNDPKFMDKLITDNKNGSYTVNFPGKPDEPVTVPKPTDAEMAIWAHGPKAAILEKAFSDHYVKHLTKGKELDEEQLEKLKSPNPSARILGGHAQDAFKLLTGKEVGVFDLSKEMDETQIKEFLEMNKGQPMTADTRFHTPSLVGPHSYSLKYDAKTNEVVLENPVKPEREGVNKESYPYEPFNIDRKAADGRDDGVFRMSIADFKKDFVRIAHLK